MKMKIETENITLTEVEELKKYFNKFFNDDFKVTLKPNLIIFETDGGEE